MLFDNIHILPVANYDLYDRTGSPIWLGCGSEIEKEKIDEIWQGINDQIIDYGGIDNEILDTVLMENEYMILLLDQTSQDDPVKKGKITNQINTLKRELEQIKSGHEVKKKSMTKRLVQISSIMGFHLPSKTTTVAEFIDYSEEATNIVKLRQKQNSDDN